MAKAFMRVDENADGFISKHEMMNLLNRFHLSMTDEHFQQYVSQVFFKTPVSQPLFRLKKRNWQNSSAILFSVCHCSLPLPS